MVMMMLATFRSAGITGIGADQAKFFCVGAVEAHELCSCITKCGAFHIKLYTFCHHLYIFFLRAGRSTVITGGSAAETGFDTSGIVIVHNNCLGEGFNYHAPDYADFPNYLPEAEVDRQTREKEAQIAQIV